ncbi:MAG TPA: hypothetical protein VJV78_45500 [Polyangiales bacterium]|nr:hypothetical protein [Polyangiales bacterium]
MGSASTSLVAGAQEAAPAGPAPTPAPVSAPAPALPPAKPAAESWLPDLIKQRRDTQGRSCELQAIASSAELRYLACGEAGVWVVKLLPGRAPEVIEQRPTPGRASGFFVRDGTLWVETTSVQAARLVPIEADAAIVVDPLGTRAGGPLPSPPPVAAAVAPHAAAARTGQLKADEDYEPVEAHVIQVEPGFAIIDMGREHGVANGDHVAFEREVPDRVDMDHTVKRRERLAVGTAVAVGETRTRVELGIAERVEVGAFAHPTREPTSARSFAPPRLGGLWHLGFFARPFLVVDNFGFGASFELRAGYRFEVPFHLEAMVVPISFATGREGGVFAATGLVMASFDSKLFEVGLGLGGQTVNDPAFDLEAGTGTTLAQRLRIGSLDGGNIEVMTYVTLFHSEFEFADVNVHAQLPVGDRSWLIANGGGGTLGMGFGELGLRVLLSGNGDKGSFFLSATIGGTHVFKSGFCEDESRNCTEVSYTGPHAGVGAEWRL